jgi:hypothetical protein
MSLTVRQREVFKEWLRRSGYLGGPCPFCGAAHWNPPAAPLGLAEVSWNRHPWAVEDTGRALPSPPWSASAVSE